MASQTYNLNTWAAKRVIGDSAARDAASALLQTGEYNLDNTWIFNRTNHLEDVYGIRYLCDTEITSGGEGEDPIIEATGQDKIELYGGYQVDNTDTPTAWVRLDTGVIHLNNRNDWSNPPAFEIMCASKLFKIKPSNQGEGIDIGYDWDNYDGAGISLRTKSSTNYPGQFTIWARRDSSHAYTLKGESGGALTWTGSFIVDRAGGTENHIIARASGYTNSNNLDVKLMVGTGKQNHGVYSTGYSTNGTAFTSSAKWLIYRNSAGNVIVNGDCTGNAATATKLATAREIYVALGTTRDTNSKVTFDGSADKAIHVSGTLGTARGGTGNTSFTQWGVVYANPATKLVTTAAGTSGYVLQGNGSAAPSWVQATNSNTASTIVKRDANGNFNGGSITATRLIATSTTDAVAGSVAAVALITGSSTGAHTEMDNNEIITKTNASTKTTFYINDGCQITADGLVKNAVWNDYAEYRHADILEPGYCVATQEDGIMYKTNERLYRNAHVVSDTYGHAIGLSDTAKTPIAVSGRVLVYPYQDKNNYHIGDCVCATYDGKVDIMTREEIKEYPDRIVGVVDEIPNYEIWDSNYTFHKNGTVISSKVPVNGRIWIYVK